MIYSFFKLHYIQPALKFCYMHVFHSSLLGNGDRFREQSICWESEVELVERTFLGDPLQLSYLIWFLQFADQCEIPLRIQIFWTDPTLSSQHNLDVFALNMWRSDAVARNGAFRRIVHFIWKVPFVANLVGLTFECLLDLDVWSELSFNHEMCPHFYAVFSSI